MYTVSCITSLPFIFVFLFLFLGASALSLTNGSQAAKTLARCLYDLCDVLRHAGFTVREMFNGFDRWP